MASKTGYQTVCMPEDIIFEILVRLPVKSLLRFKSVRKSWYAIIKTSDFIRRHRVNMENSNNTNLGTFVFEYLDHRLAYYCSDIDMAATGLRQFLIVSGENSLNGHDNLGLGIIPCLANSSVSMADLTFAGSCHGVLCFYHQDVRKGIVLCNPTTRHSKLLGKPLGRRSGTCFVAFGFDAITSDYKVLCVKFFVDAPYYISPEIQVYKRSTNSWKRINSNFISAQSCSLDGSKQGRYLNGNYYCIGKQEYQTIVSFDFNKEVFRPIPVPSDDCDTWSTDVIQLDSIRDKLVCIKESNRCRGPTCVKTFKVWVLNDFIANDKNCSWTMLHKFSTANEYDRWVPMAISRNKQFSFISVFNDTKLYNFVTGEIEDWSFGEGIKLTKTDVYKESLISV
ncbi:F-box/kelch-repeat protein At3g23880-like [Papaver somniferum]|uniref:F-box/kelch-repeat protein At3g23880-like n=1 Tax=Papaver somniferum TaxID=3469 RepID=UPI000E6F7EAC|nr:F-box/kelch-repeat protein At3g23880-like [Papaver somniferum]